MDRPPIFNGFNWLADNLYFTKEENFPAPIFVKGFTFVLSCMLFVVFEALNVTTETIRVELELAVSGTVQENTFLRNGE